MNQRKYESYGMLTTHIVLVLIWHKPLAEGQFVIVDSHCDSWLSETRDMRMKRQSSSHVFTRTSPVYRQHHNSRSNNQQQNSNLENLLRKMCWCDVRCWVFIDSSRNVSPTLLLTTSKGARTPKNPPHGRGHSCNAPGSVSVRTACAMPLYA